MGLRYYLSRRTTPLVILIKELTMKKIKAFAELAVANCKLEQRIAELESANLILLNTTIPLSKLEDMLTIYDSTSVYVKDSSRAELYALFHTIGDDTEEHN